LLVIIKSQAAKMVLARYLEERNEGHLEFLRTVARELGPIDEIHIPEDAELRRRLEEARDDQENAAARNVDTNPQHHYQ
jgi:hypothetical protein